MILATKPFEPEACTGLIFVGCSPMMMNPYPGHRWEIPVVLVEFTYKGLDAVIRRISGRVCDRRFVIWYPPGHKRLIYVGPRDERAESLSRRCSVQG